MLLFIHVFSFSSYIQIIMLLLTMMDVFNAFYHKHILYVFVTHVNVL